MAEMTLEQQRAVAVASARLRLQQTQTQPVKSPFDIQAFRAEKPVADESLLKQAGQLAIEEAPLIGSIVGGLAGAAAGPAGSAALGGLLGTVAGTSIGTSIKQLKEQSEGKVKSLKATLGEQVSNVAEQSMYDLIGQSIGAGVVNAINRGIPFAREGAATAQKMLERRGGTLTMSQAAESPTIGLAESLARAGAGGKGQFIGLDKRNADAMQAIKESLIQNISKDPVSDPTAGKLFQNAIKKGESAHSIAATALYKDFDSRITNTLVDVSQVRKMGAGIAEEFERIGNVGKTDAGGKLIDQIRNLPDVVTFSDAHLLRSNLLATIRDLKVSGQETKALRNATNFAMATEHAMEQSAKKLPGDVYAQYRQISAFYRKGKEAFNNDVITSLVQKQPERVGEELFKSGNVSEIIQAKASLRQAAVYDKSVNAVDTMNRLRAGYLNALLTTKSATTKEGETVATNLLKELATAKSDRQFMVMFSQTQRDAINEFARTAYLVASNKPAQFGILAPLLQAQAIGNLLSGGLLGEVTATERPPIVDVGVILSPYLLSKILTNPRAVRILTQALKLPIGTTAGTSVVVKLAGEFSRALQAPATE